MNLPNNYWKVELKIFYEKDHISHIEKDFYTTKEGAEKCFHNRFEIAEYGYLQSRFDKYTLVLAECDTEKKLTRIHKTREAPL